MPLPADWVALVQAPPHKLLVERAEQPLVRGLIIIPPGIRSATRASEARVVSVGSGVAGFAAGDGILLASSVSGGIAFGDRDEIKFALVAPFQVMARIENGRQQEDEEASREPLVARDQPGRFLATDDALRALDVDHEPGGSAAGFDEGDRRGKR